MSNPDPDIAGGRSLPRGDRPVRLHGDGGAAMVELALLLPFLAVVVLGSLDIGRAFALRNRLTNMAHEGAFYAQHHSSNVTGCVPTSITATALAEDRGLSGATVTAVNAGTGVAITNDCGAPTTPGLRVRVRVSKPMTVLTPFVGVVTGNRVTVAGDIEVVAQG